MLPSVALPADPKGSLLCYEGLAELLAFQGKVRLPHSSFECNLVTVKHSSLVESGCFGEGGRAHCLEHAVPNPLDMELCSSMG